MKEILRIGRNAIVSFPNFGHFSLRLQLMLSGRMPKSAILPFEWYRSPNIHLMTLSDFESFCGQLGIEIVDRFYVRNGRHYRRVVWANLRAEGVVLQLGCQVVTGALDERRDQ
jgi:methionine biosynthesis protein MetW